MMKLALVALFALVGMAVAATHQSASFAFSGNVTLANNDQFAYRTVGMGAWNLLLWSGAFYSSVEVKAQSNTGSLDSLWGAAYVGLAAFPVTTLAYFNIDATFGSNTNWAQLDVSGSAGYIANAYIGLTEKTSAGDVVAFHSFKEILWTFVEAKSNNGLHWATFTATKANKFSATLTYFASEVVGTVDIAGETIVTPRTLESVFSIDNYAYVDASNTVTLTLGVASGSASGATSGVLTVGSGSEQMFLSLAANALVGTEIKPVQISAFASADVALYFNTDVQAQLSGKFGATAAAQIVNVTFPAGATSFEYDPTIGNGEVPQVANSGFQSAPAMFLLAAVMAVKLLL